MGTIVVRTIHRTGGLEGAVRCSVSYRGVVDQHIPYSYSLNFSKQFSYINYFNPSYGLKDIKFTSLIQFKIPLVSGLINKFN